MTDKQINIVEIMAEQCKNCTLYEGDTVSLNISIFDRQLKGVCFNNNIYFSVDELNYIMQKFISKEQECDELKAELELFKTSNQTTIDQLKATLTEIKEIINESFGSCYTCNSEIACKKCIRGNILNKISECEK